MGPGGAQPAGTAPAGGRGRAPDRTGGPGSQREVRAGHHRLSPTGPSRIEVRGLSKRFGARMAVELLDFEVDQGEVFGLLGPNGAGKTTTVRMLSGLLRPSAGSAKVCGV